MASAEPPSLRFNRFETKWLVIAIVVSLLIHLAGWGGYEYAKKHGWWDKLNAMAFWHKSLKKTQTILVKKEEAETQPTVYIESSRSDDDAPKNPVYFSDKNSHAANPDADQDSNKPKLDGKQTDYLKLEDVTKPMRLLPISPAAPAAPPEQNQKPAPQTSPQNLGDQQLAKPKDSQQPPDNSAPKRPRTLKEARAQQHQPQVPGQQSRMDGGVTRHELDASFDTKATPFGEYNSKMVAAIQQYWEDELDRNQYAEDRIGRVTIRFDLHYDGSVDRVEIINNEVGTLLGSFCQEAIDQTAPYEKWPNDMLHEIGETKFTVTFTFHYY